MAKKDRDEPRRPFKNVPFIRITALAFVILFFVSISFICSSWRDEGILGNGAIRNFFADIYIIYQYPAVYLFYHSGFYNWPTYMLGLIIDAYLYAIVIRLLCKLIYNLTAKFRKPKEVKEISIR
jgi:hypothetical protein